jgi:hypothetical protein
VETASCYPMTRSSKGLGRSSAVAPPPSSSTTRRSRSNRIESSWPAVDHRPILRPPAGLLVDIRAGEFAHLHHRQLAGREPRPW